MFFFCITENFNTIYFRENPIRIFITIFIFICFFYFIFHLFSHRFEFFCYEASKEICAATTTEDTLDVDINVATINLNGNMLTLLSLLCTFLLFIMDFFVYRMNFLWIFCNLFFLVYVEPSFPILKCTNDNL